MQPRGQLWFALEALCRDFQTCSGLPEQDALKILVIVLTNMLADKKGELDKLIAALPPPSS